jgi:hypothetical protein
MVVESAIFTPTHLFYTNPINHVTGPCFEAPTVIG